MYEGAGGHQIRDIAFYERGKCEAFAARHDDVGAAVGHHFHVSDLGHAAHAAHRQVAFGDTWYGGNDAETPVARAHIGQQLPIARFEEVQRQQGTGKQHDAQREHGQQEIRHVGNISRRRVVRSVERRFGLAEIAEIALAGVAARELVAGAVLANTLKQHGQLGALTVGEPAKHDALCLRDDRGGGAEQSLAFFSQRGMHDATVIGITVTGHQAGNVEPVEHSGEVGTRSGQMRAQLAASGAALASYCAAVTLNGSSARASARSTWAVAVRRMCTVDARVAAAAESGGFAFIANMISV